jgi:hypothetical protein
VPPLSADTKDTKDTKDLKDEDSTGLPRVLAGPCWSVLVLALLDSTGA